jgi:hypothetical protein
MTIAKQRVCDIRVMRNAPRALHSYNNTQVPNDNTYDKSNEGRAILRHEETGLR